MRTVHLPTQPRGRTRIRHIVIAVNIATSGHRTTLRPHTRWQSRRNTACRRFNATVGLVSGMSLRNYRSRVSYFTRLLLLYSTIQLVSPETASRCARASLRVRWSVCSWTPLYPEAPRYLEVTRGTQHRAFRRGRCGGFRPRPVRFVP